MEDGTGGPRTVMDGEPCGSGWVHIGPGATPVRDPGGTDSAIPEYMSEVVRDS